MNLQNPDIRTSIEQIQQLHIANFNGNPWNQGNTWGIGMSPRCALWCYSGLPPETCFISRANWVTGTRIEGICGLPKVKNMLLSENMYWKLERLKSHFSMFGCLPSSHHQIACSQVTSHGWIVVDMGKQSVSSRWNEWIKTPIRRSDDRVDPCWFTKLEVWHIWRYCSWQSQWWSL